MEADLPARGFGRRCEERLDLPPEAEEGLVVGEEGFVDFCEAFEDFGIGGEVLAHLHESPHDEEAHLHCLRAVEHGRGHDGPMFGEGVGGGPSAALF